jgi:hypothetical protein
MHGITELEDSRMVASRLPKISSRSGAVRIQGWPARWPGMVAVVTATPPYAVIRVAIGVLDERTANVV